ncbi:MAG: hypothetical protein M1826_001255 [Phylliscum demangeonii]|nr:MAG: hypothetical protein M1826_001255 [Phylliscum demangeonii]
MAATVARNALLAIRGLVGISCLLWPGLTSRVVMLPLETASDTILFRLFGSRDLVVAWLLYASPTPDERRRALIAGAVVDAIDVCSSAACILEGNMGLGPAITVGAGALSLVGLASLALTDSPPSTPTRVPPRSEPIARK